MYVGHCPDFDTELCMPQASDGVIQSHWLRHLAVRCQAPSFVSKVTVRRSTSGLCQGSRSSSVGSVF